MKNTLRAILATTITTVTTVTAFISTSAATDGKVLNLYSSRHYQTDEALYTNFEKATGIKINRIEAPEDPLLERMKNEGARSPADVLLTADMGRLLKAQEAGLFQPIKSSALDKHIPAELRAPDGSWYGFSVRARPIVYAKAKLNPTELPDYESLTDPKWKGTMCVRSSSSPYNRSMLSSIIAAHGPLKAEEWARGIVANMARAPKGGDTDQIKAVAAGECDIAISNTYYFARLLKSDKAEDKALVAKVGVIFPNQNGANGRGTHINISGAGVAKYAPNKANAIKFLEYLATPEAQSYFANGNNEYPVVGKASNRELDAIGSFKRDPLKMDMVGKNYAAAAQIFDRVGWK